MSIIEQYKKDTVDAETNTDDSLLNHILNEKLNKEYQKLENDKKLLESIENNNKNNENNNININNENNNNNENKNDDNNNNNINNNNIINNNINNNNNNENIKTENKNDKKNEQNLGFFGRLMAPILLTENDIENLN